MMLRSPIFERSVLRRGLISSYRSGRRLTCSRLPITPSLRAFFTGTGKFAA